MNCPRCKTHQLQQDRLHEAAVVYHAWSCPFCKGLWLTLDELTSLSMEEKAAFVEVRQLLGEKAQAEPLACLECGKPMEKVESHRDPNVVIDVCGSCKKAWLDGGELKAIQTESLFALIGNLVRWLRDPAKKQT